MESRERPINLRAHEVRAILEGGQTQLRRVIKPQIPEQPLVVGLYAPTKVDRYGEEYPGDDVFGCYGDDWGRVCPFGQPGDRLWVRETWGWEGEFEADPSGAFKQEIGRHIIFRAEKDIPNWQLVKGWLSSAVMPRSASRILLEVMSVRVERMQDISEGDAIAQGIEEIPFGECGHMAEDGTCYLTAKAAFQRDSDDLWSSNPWVWVVEFRRVEQ